MIHRPTSITVIGWLLVVGGVLSLPNLCKNFIDPRRQESMASLAVPVSLQHALWIGGTVICLLCGYFLLKGKNWARYLYISWIPIQLLHSYLISESKLMMLPSVLVDLLIIYFLFRPVANTFFASNAAEVGIENRMTTRQLLGICSYIMAGVFFSSSSLLTFMSYSSEQIAGVIVKATVFCILLLPAAVFLSFGRVLSPYRRWRYEVGIVLLASAAGGALLILTIALMFQSPEYQKTLGPETAAAFSDYTTGILWLGTMGALGALGIYSGRDKSSIDRYDA